MLDVACGGGDAILSLGRWARREGCDLQIDGPVALRIAEQRARGAGLDRFGFFELDALRQPLPEGYDVIACSLFLHHLSDEDAGQLLKKMAAAARHLVLVSDLRRNAIGYALGWLGCRLLTRSPVVHVDGPRSVAAAFTDGELRALAASSGLAGVTVVRRWPQRMLLVWKRT
jgi:2-polyprenyl-3-methyl-5-hydroxy-6-metoxy-1,4-benzoquinol methylase